MFKRDKTPKIIPEQYPYHEDESAVQETKEIEAYKLQVTYKDGEKEVMECDGFRTPDHSRNHSGDLLLKFIDNAELRINNIHVSEDPNTYTSVSKEVKRWIDYDEVKKLEVKEKYVKKVKAKAIIAIRNYLDKDDDPSQRWTVKKQKGFDVENGSN